MKSERRITKLQLEGFDIGKICRWPGKEHTFLFDSFNPAAVLLSPAGEELGRWDLTEVQRIDAVLCTATHLLISDAPGRKLHRWTLSEPLKGSPPFSNHEAVDMSPNSVIVAMAPLASGYLLLDKNACLLRVLGPGLKEKRTIGSRMGYIHGEESDQRLGFEFPEDMLVIGDHTWISDSGNKRLVVLNRQWKTEAVFPLPEYPFKFVFYDDQKVAVSDFDRSLMFVSNRYGFVCREELDIAADFFPADTLGDRCLLASENRNTDSPELIELRIPAESVESMAQESGNRQVSMHCHIDAQRLEEARSIALAEEELLPEYARCTSDRLVEKPLTQLVEKRFRDFLEKNAPFTRDIVTLAQEYLKKYKAIPDSGDIEAAQIEKANVEHRLFKELKAFRLTLKQVAGLGAFTSGYPAVTEVLGRLSDREFQRVNRELQANRERIEANIENFNEDGMLEAMTRYWLLCEEGNRLFKSMGFRYEKILQDKYLTGILADFYNAVAEVYLYYRKSDRYISFADKEISLFPDKIGIAGRFIGRLLNLRKYDDVERMLKKMPGQNKENVNFFYYRLYLGRGDREKACLHLKKELEFFPHKTTLVPRLIALKQLGPEEEQAYIHRMLEKAGHGIDVYLDIARAFFAAGDMEKAESFLDTELELYPENQSAWILKATMFPSPCGDKADPAYARKNWDLFRTFIKVSRDEKIAFQLLSQFKVLNILEWKEDVDINPLIKLRDTVRIGPYQEELDIFLSYLKHHRLLNLEDAPQEFTLDVYLSTHSTALMAFDDTFARMEHLRNGRKWDELFDLVEILLKYNPGNQKVFHFLDDLLEAETV